MSDDTGYSVFEFTRSPTFHKHMNRDGYFDTLEMDGLTSNYEIVFANNCTDGFTGNVDEYGRLNNSVKILPYNKGDGDVILWCDWDAYGNATIIINEKSLTVNFEDINLTLKALFLRDKSTGYVLAYSILTRPVPVSNQVVFPIDGAIWNLKQEIQDVKECIQ